MAEILEVRLESCNISDVMGSMFVLAVFLAPNVTRFSYVNNICKLFVKNTLIACVKEQPNKLREFNMSQSISVIEICDQICRSFANWRELMKINLSNLPFSLNSCRSFSWYMLR